MQNAEMEFNIPLTMRNGKRSNFSNASQLLASHSKTSVLTLGLGILLLHASYTFLSGIWFITYPFGIIYILFSLLFALMMIPVDIRALRTGSWQLRISHEGIFYCYPLPVFIRWDEITTLASERKGADGRHLVIIVKDEMPIFERFITLNSIHRWERAYYYFLANTNTWLSHSFPETSMSLPISNLMKIIQEYFATELYEYRISIRVQYGSIFEEYVSGPPPGSK
jgi:hypothetical protein